MVNDIPETENLRSRSEIVQNLLQEMGFHSLLADIMLSPFDIARYVIENKGNESTTKSIANNWYSKTATEALLTLAAEAAGVTVEELQCQRAPEQAKFFQIIHNLFTERHIELFKASRYCQAMRLLKPLEQHFDDRCSIIDLKRQAVLYFFATNEELESVEPEPLTEPQKEKIIDVFYRLDKFYMEHYNEEENDSTEPLTLYDFIESENPGNTTLPIIITKKIQEISYPLDKVNSSFWGLMPGEQATLKAESDRDSRKGKEANIYVLLDFDEMKGTGITISRPLTSYDKRVFIAAANLKEQGHDTVTTAQIYEAMGNKGRPATSQRRKILRSIETMSLCRVTLDNTEEAAIYTKYDKVKRTFYLLPTTIDKGYVNGLVVDDAINIIELPRLFTFAKQRGQFASTSVALLESPMSQTEANLQLEDYLLTRISRMKNAKKHKKPCSPVILLDTLYKNCNINDKHKRSRATEKIERLLQHYQKEGFIKGYKLTAKSIDINI